LASQKTKATNNRAKLSATVNKCWT